MRRRVIVLLALAAVASGCAVTDTSRYYALGTLHPPTAVERPVTSGGLTIGVGPVAIPGYLDRPQMVTRDAGGGLEIWPYHRWAESLEIGIAEALADDLAARVPGDRVAVYPWRGTLARIIDYQVAVQVARFEGTPGQAVTLDARWRLMDRDGKEVAFKRTMLTEAITGQGFPPLVAAMNRAISHLGEEIGRAIQSQPANRASTGN